MTMQLDGYRAVAMPVLQIGFDGSLVPVVLVEPDQSGALLDELDDHLAALGAALAERDAAASLFDETDRTARMASERVQLLKLAIKARLAAGSER